jgi:hypothetical protein
VLTARSGEALEWSVEWLELNGLPFDEVAGSEEARKSLHGADALVDDYLENIKEFIANTSGPAVLVDQPWNRDGRGELTKHASAGRLAIVRKLADVPVALHQLVC